MLLKLGLIFIVIVIFLMVAYSLGLWKTILLIAFGVFVAFFVRYALRKLFGGFTNG